MTQPEPTMFGFALGFRLDRLGVLQMKPTEPDIYELVFLPDGWHVTRNGQPIAGPLSESKAQDELARAEREHERAA